MTRHTPGPWEADDIYIMAGQKNVAVAVVAIFGDAGGAHIIPHNEARANAQLLAAAPDLLTSLRDAISEIAIMDVSSLPRYDQEHYLKAICILEAGVAKATPDTDG